jgi:hypothetical protein
VLEQVQPAEHLAGPAHERLEQRELLRGELHPLGAAPSLPRGRVEPEVADLEDRGPLLLPSPGERAEPC